MNSNNNSIKYPEDFRDLLVRWLNQYTATMKTRSYIPDDGSQIYIRIIKTIQRANQIKEWIKDDKSNNSLSNDEQISKYMQEIGVDLEFFCSVGLIPNPIKVEYNCMSNRVKEKYRKTDRGTGR